MAAILYCRHCNTGYAAAGLIPSVCPRCLCMANWTTRLGPRIDYQLTTNDRRFLNALRIQTEDEEQQA